MSINAGIVFAAIICALAGYIIGYSSGRTHSLELMNISLKKFIAAYREATSNDKK